MDTLNRDLSIVAQVAAKEAGSIVRTLIENGGSWDENQFTLIAAHINDVIVNLVADGTPAPRREQNVVAQYTAPDEVIGQHFPDAVVVTQPSPAPTPAPVASAVGYLASIGLYPHQISTTSDEKVNLQAHVADLDANPGGWFDNRFNKRNPKGPDFKNKTTGVALWVR
jgi:hypothetical protein